MSTFDTMTVTRLRYPALTRHGSTTTDFRAEPATHDIAGCWIEPLESEDAPNARNATKTGYRLKLPFGSSLVDATDHVLIDGIEYELEGDAFHVRSPTGYLNHTQAKVTRWEG
ncbi:hypothetical protein K8P10_001984 [Leucobacter sp. Psy1]|uniref:hypothetical protein n=1 Tax=Leucobacter sp. Psy1 TaxID=2875729 RepID=UPI001CD2B3D1|nr:hypothetical protein [Leucobacter sp. Psy1]UBH06473.1 hypothetical protein K8P10_001984 [Leucobacter sp. Psy1]